MKTRIKIEAELDPWMFGHFTQAAATLNCSVEEAVLAFLKSDQGGDALCEWANDGFEDPETLGARYDRN